VAQANGFSLHAGVAAQADSAEAQAGQGKKGACATSMGWARGLMRVFAIEIERCERSHAHEYFASIQ
jgi:hypothetical protein